METLFQIFIVECSRIILQLSELPVMEEQMSLFEEFAEINLLFNGFNLLHKYKDYLWEHFTHFKEILAQPDSGYSHAELHRMLLHIKECELCYYRLELENRKIWQHYHSYLPFDSGISEFQKKRILCKVSDFLVVQKHFLQLLRIYIKGHLELYPHLPETKPPHKNKKTATILDYDLFWGGGKSDLVELNTVLYYSGKVISRNHKLSFRAFQHLMGQLFHVDLSDYSNVATNLYKRKKQSSVFLPKMVEFFNEFVAQR